MNHCENTVLITGGGSGIGLALARTLIDLNNTVIIVGRDEEKLLRAKKAYPGMHVIKCDITCESERENLVNEINEQFPSLNILINNAGVAFFGDIRKSDSYTNIVNEVDTNYLAPVRLTQLFLSLLVTQPSAAIVNITTIAAYLPLTMMPGYSASKAALHSFTLSLREQLEDTSVNVYEVLPPPVDTPMVVDFHMSKLSPEVVAERIVQGLMKDRFDMPIGMAKNLRYAARFFPGFIGRLSKRHLLKVIKRND